MFLLAEHGALPPRIAALLVRPPGAPFDILLTVPYDCLSDTGPGSLTTRQFVDRPHDSRGARDLREVSFLQGLRRVQVYPQILRPFRPLAESGAMAEELEGRR